MAKHLSHCAPRRKKGFLPRLETLEDRCLLAVSVSQVGGTLIVTGDGRANNVSITDRGTASAGNITVSIDGNTLTATSGVTDIQVNTKGGNDKVVYNHVGILVGGAVRQVNVNLGAGNDTFAAEYQASGLAAGAREIFTVFGGAGNAVENFNASPRVDIAAGASLTALLRGKRGKNTFNINYVGKLDGGLQLVAFPGRGKNKIIRNITPLPGSTSSATNAEMFTSTTNPPPPVVVNPPPVTVNPPPVAVNPVINLNPTITVPGSVINVGGSAPIISITQPLGGIDLSSLDLSKLHLFPLDLSGLGLPSLDLTHLDLSNLKVGGLDLSSLDLSKLDPTKLGLGLIDLNKLSQGILSLGVLDLSKFDLSKLDLSKLGGLGLGTVLLDLSHLPQGILNLGVLALNKLPLSSLLGGVNLDNIDLSKLGQGLLDLNKLNLLGIDVSKLNLNSLDLSKLGLGVLNLGNLGINLDVLGLNIHLEVDGLLGIL
jgi:uncharacterized protein YjbI with pentapeptide repeats